MDKNVNKSHISPLSPVPNVMIDQRNNYRSHPVIDDTLGVLPEVIKKMNLTETKSSQAINDSSLCLLL